MDNEKKAKLFKAFCDEQRLTILDIIKDKEHCACDILEQMEISQSTLSHHMKILCESEIVASRKEGKWTYYELNPERLAYAVKILDDLLLVDNTKTDNTSVCC